MPKAQWTPEMVREAIDNFVARMQRLPHGREWQSAYGLPSRETVLRLYSSLEEAIVDYNKERMA